MLDARLEPFSLQLLLLLAAGVAVCCNLKFGLSAAIHAATEAAVCLVAMAWRALATTCGLDAVRKQQLPPDRHRSSNSSMHGYTSEAPAPGHRELPTAADSVSCHAADVSTPAALVAAQPAPIAEATAKVAAITQLSVESGMTSPTRVTSSSLRGRSASSCNATCHNGADTSSSKASSRGSSSSALQQSALRPATPGTPGTRSPHSRAAAASSKKHDTLDALVAAGSNDTATSSCARQRHVSIRSTCSSVPSSPIRSSSFLPSSPVCSSKKANSRAFNAAANQQLHQQQVAYMSPGALPKVVSIHQQDAVPVLDTSGLADVVPVDASPVAEAVGAATALSSCSGWKCRPDMTANIAAVEPNCSSGGKIHAATACGGQVDTAAGSVDDQSSAEMPDSTAAAAAAAVLQLLPDTAVAAGGAAHVWPRCIHHGSDFSTANQHNHHGGPGAGFFERGPAAPPPARTTTSAAAGASLSIIISWPLPPSPEAAAAPATPPAAPPAAAGTAAREPKGKKCHVCWAPLPPSKELWLQQQRQMPQQQKQKFLQKLQNTQRRVWWLWRQQRKQQQQQQQQQQEVSDVDVVVTVLKRGRSCVSSASGNSGSMLEEDSSSSISAKRVMPGVL